MSQRFARDPEHGLAGCDVVVVGAGRSGRAAAELCAAHGAHVVLTDVRDDAPLREQLAALGGRVQLELGGHRRDSFTGAQLIVVSPGVPPLDELAAARDAGTPVIGEVELAARFVSAPLVGITGTNGKSTTTELTGRMLAASGVAAFWGGNLGQPLSEAVLAGDPALGPGGVVVLELSSFQLETVESFHAHIAVLLNLSEDHLDRYPDYRAYRLAKARLFERQQPEDIAVINGRSDQRLCAELAADTPAQMVLFSGAPDDSLGARQEGDQLVLRLPGQRSERYPRSALRLPGRHNGDNALAALLAARLAGASHEGCLDALRRFEGLAHRMQLVGERAGVRFYDDSKATNVGAVVGSLDGFERPVVLIAGGKDKGGDYAPLRRVVAQVCRHVVLIGAAADRIATSLGSEPSVHRATTLESAVQRAAELARSGDAVVLSPACSSYDMFIDYRERGEVFARAVAGLDDVP